MMNYPEIFDSFFGMTPARRAPWKTMNTDIVRGADTTEIRVDLPGFDKDDIRAELKNGYLTVTAKHETENGEKDEEGRYICRERYTGSCSRSFYVGADMTEEDVAARFENGVLTLTIPTEVKKAEPEQKKYIAIA